MSGTFNVTLEAWEWDLVSAIRSVPESPLRDRLLALLQELARFAEDPKCTEAQADGDPCTSTKGDCDSCKKITDLIDALRHRLVALEAGAGERG